jgi:hypothetical protein
MLENLVVAVESEAQVVDLGRVAGFMQKVSPVCLALSERLSHFPFKVRDGNI